MSSKSLLFRNIKTQARVHTGTLANNGHIVKPTNTVVKKPSVTKVVKDTGSTIDNIDQSLKENVSFQESNYNAEKNTLVDENIVDDNSQDTTDNNGDDVIK